MFFLPCEALPTKKERTSVLQVKEVNTEENNPFFPIVHQS